MKPPTDNWCHFKTLSASEVIEKAITCLTIEEAIAWACICEHEESKKRENQETCFLYYITEIIKAWKNKTKITTQIHISIEPSK
jgi:hypothetical protein